MAFMELVEVAKHYPSAKKTWLEYLGEPVAHWGISHAALRSRLRH